MINALVDLERNIRNAAWIDFIRLLQMNIEKLLKCIHQLDSGHNMLMQYVINDVLQEIMDSESFQDHGSRDVSTKQLLDEITTKTDEHLAQMILTCVIEFCITNYYYCDGKSWNFIKYYLDHHKEHLTKEEQDYLADLNNSYRPISNIGAKIPISILYEQ